MKKSHSLFSLSPAAVVCLAALTLSACSAPPAKPELGRIESRLSGLLELPAVEYIYRDVVYLGKTKSFLFITTVDKRLLFSLNLRVRAGLDLRQGFKLVAVSPTTVEVQLPPARILSVDADEASIREFFIVEQGEKIGRLEYAEEIERAKPRIEKDAIERGMLTAARAAAESLVGGFLAAAGFSEVRFARLPP